MERVQQLPARVSGESWGPYAGVAGKAYPVASLLGRMQILLSRKKPALKEVAPQASKHDRG